jgi:hypothetical protein
VAKTFSLWESLLQVMAARNVAERHLSLRSPQQNVIKGALPADV